MGRSAVKVGQLNQYIGRILKTDPILADVSVIGEISNLKFHDSGHIYFSLKDENARVGCFLSAQNSRYMTVPLEEGMEVVASGYISVYERGGSYSLNVLDIEAGEQGQLAVRFEELKKKLSEEGVFDREKKKELPVFPLRIAVVTSPTGAAVRDMLKIIQNRNDCVSILIYPVLVQGPSAAKEISDAIDDLNENHSDIDIIITGRGGGSAEELWAFNEEAVVRSIYRSKIPVISAVGHEIDVTLSDFAADVRAETPTAAAQIAVPDTGVIREELEELKEQLNNDIEHMIEYRSHLLDVMDPSSFAEGLRSRAGYEQMHLEDLYEQMNSDIMTLIDAYRHKTELFGEILETASPYRLLSQGYSMITGSNGHLIKSIENVKKGDDISIRLYDGILNANVLDKIKEAADEQQ